MRIIQNAKRYVLLGVAIALAAGSGLLTATAVLGSSDQAPTRTTTITLTNGEKGEPGAAGPPGPPGQNGTPGAEGCPTGSTFEALVVNHPGGQVEIWTCIKNGG